MKPLEAEVGRLLRKRGLTLAIAESCTGGLTAHRVTNVPGSSGYFVMGVVAYSNASKSKVLSVSKAAMRKFGAVSHQIAAAMASAVRRVAGSDLGIGITGIAGPTGGTPTKPVGLVYVALATSRARIVREYRFRGNRLTVKRRASQAALAMLQRYVA